MDGGGFNHRRVESWLGQQGSPRTPRPRARRRLLPRRKKVPALESPAPSPKQVNGGGETGQEPGCPAAPTAQSTPLPSFLRSSPEPAPAWTKRRAPQTRGTAAPPCHALPTRHGGQTHNALGGQYGGATLTLSPPQV